MSFWDLLIQSATIQEPQEMNSGGVVQRSWIDRYNNIPARLVANRGSAKKGAENIERYVRGEFTLFLDFYPDITEKMKAIIEGQEYEIVFVAKVLGKYFYNHLELQLNKVIQ